MKRKNLNKEDFLQIIDRYLNGKSSVEEEELLINYYERSFQNGNEWDSKLGLEKDVKEIIHLRILNKINEESKKKSNVIAINYKEIFKYVAAILIVISTGYYFTKDKLNNNAQEIVKTDSEIKIGTDKATLTLEDGSIVVLEKGKKFNQANAKSDGEKIVYSIGDAQVEEKITYNYLTIPRGGQFYIELADGTEVWLNSETKLKYPTKFVSGKSRKVELIYGEAYFDVSPSSNHNGATFQVHNTMQNIEVIGTQFNMKSYANDNYIETTLVEGEISLEVDSEKNILLPNQQLTFNINSSNIEKRIVDVTDFVSWKEGYFTFEDNTLEEACKLMSRWYDIDFVIQNEEIKDILLSGQISKNQNIEHILITLKNIKDLSYEITNDKIYIK